jgi:hypothetical protein
MEGISCRVIDCSWLEKQLAIALATQKYTHEVRDEGKK